MSALTCLIRKVAVAATPEEVVRQRLLFTMVHKLGFPESLIAVEKSLEQLPHIKKAPLRRVDLLCFADGIHPAYPLYPLLLVECKAVKLTDKVLSQICGYNYYVKAPFVAAANQEEVRLGSLDPKTGGYRFISGLPSFQELKTACSLL